MKIALISDELTRDALSFEKAIIYHITPSNYKTYLKKDENIDFLFVESAWHGYENSWKFKIASYPNRPWRSNRALKRVVTYAKSLHIPTVFWNKEDGVHFQRFIKSAKLFDHIFTVDSNCIKRYKNSVPKETTVNTLMFAVQPKFHYFDGFHIKHHRANFVGSYSLHIHHQRRMWQDMMFHATIESGLGLTVFDRNSNRKSSIYRYPKIENLTVHSAVPYAKTAQIYKEYLVNLNVNTIEDSPTMFSRRLIEIIACGGLAITNPSPAVQALFAPYCYIVHNKEEIEALCQRLYRDGLTLSDKEKLQKGATYIAQYHTWKHRLDEIIQVIQKTKN